VQSPCSIENEIAKRQVFLFNVIIDVESFLSQYRSALTTFDILRHYAAMPIKDIEDIASIIDDVSNGTTLQSDVHIVFDNFKWSLRETEVCYIV
jgi:hypothetical protein